MDAIIDLNQLAGQLAAAVVFLIPGLNTTWIIDRLVGRTAPPGTERLLKALSWSVLIYLLASPWLLDDLIRFEAARLGAWGPLVAGAVLFVLIPLALALLVAGLRRAEWIQRPFRRATGIHPAPTAWDFAFTTFRSGFVLARLRDRRLMGGSFGANSFASAYPESQDLFIERAWRLSEEGEFVEPLRGTRGLLIQADSIESVQFFAEVTRDGSKAHEEH